MDSLIQIKKYAEEIQGQWNGDKPGRAEDCAHAATEILEKIGEIEALLDEIEEL